jgi:hypothetical protein
MAEKFTTDPCAACGGVSRHAEGCPYDPTWEPYEARGEGVAHECPRCDRAYHHADEADRCPCEPEKCVGPAGCASCQGCGRLFGDEQLEGGCCPECLARYDEEEQRHEWNEAMRVIDQGGPWY